MMLVFV